MKSFQKSFVLTVVCVFCASLAGAQVKPKTTTKAAKAPINYSVTWGPDLKLKGDAPDKILLYENGSFYAITDKSYGMWGSSDYISKLNSNLDLVLQKKLETEKSDKNVSKHEMVSILEFNKQIYIVTRDRSSKEKSVTYYMEKLNLSTLETDGVKKKIYEVDYSEDSKRSDVSLSILQHEKSDVLVLYDNHRIKKDENVRLTVTAIDKTITPIWKKDFEMPLMKGKNFDFDKYIDPQSNLYLIAKVYFEDEKGKRKEKDVVDGEINFDYHIYMIGKDIPTFVDYPFQLKDKVVSQVNLDINTKGELIACGFYSDIEKQKRVSSKRGVFYTIIDPATKTIKAQSYKTFDTEVFTAGLSAKKAAKMEDKLESGKADGYAGSYKIRELIPRKDGGSTMIAENYYTYTVTYSNGRNTYTVTHYVYGNVIVTKINEAGEIEWTSVIPKMADVTGGTMICSYLSFDEGNDSYDIFFNDHKDNLVAAQQTAKGTKPIDGSVKKMRFVRVVVSPDGTMSKKEVALKMDEDDEKTRLSPTVSEQVSDSEIILYGVDKGKDKFAKITYKNLDKASTK